MVQRGIERINCRKVVIRYEKMTLYHYQQPVYEIIEEKRGVVACPEGCCGSIQTAPLPKRILPKVGGYDRKFSGSYH